MRSATLFEPAGLPAGIATNPTLADQLPGRFTHEGHLEQHTRH